MMIDHTITNSVNKASVASTASTNGLSINDQSSGDQKHHAIRKASCNAYKRHAKRAEASSQTKASIPSSLARPPRGEAKISTAARARRASRARCTGRRRALAPYPVRIAARVDIRDRA